MCSLIRNFAYGCDERILPKPVNMDSITQYIQLPIQNPTFVFFIVLAIILFAPIVFSKLRIPHIVGLIIAGAIIGEHGFNILERDDSFRLFGQVGIYYIMFLAGLEMNLGGLKENRRSGITFGLLTALIPFILGYASGYYLLHYTHMASLLLACIFASHTLVAYPIVARYGVSKSQSVQTAVVGTMIALLFALVVLAGISGIFNGEGGVRFWMFFVLKFALFITFLFFILPICVRAFFKKFADPVLQFSFVLAAMMLCAAVADLCGLEGILGAFLSGLVFNRYVPHSGPLMNRVEFVGNAIFIPFFLIGVGMLVNIKPLFESTEPVFVVVVMVVAGTLSKWIAAFCSRKILKLKSHDGLMLFGLSEAHAAGALAMVMVGNSLISTDGTPLMSSAVLDGVVVMILLSCIISSIATEQAAKQLKIAERSKASEQQKKGDDEKILIPINELEDISNLVGIGIMMRNENLNRGLICLNIVNDEADISEGMQHSKECLDKAKRICDGSNVKVQLQSRIAVDYASATTHAFRENDASEILIGLHRKRTPNDTLLGDFTKRLTDMTRRQIIAAHFSIPHNTIRRIVVAMPEQAEFENGFTRWLERIARIVDDVGCELFFFGLPGALNSAKNYLDKSRKVLRTKFTPFHMKEGLEQLKDVVNEDHLLVVVSARHGTISYQANITKINEAIKKHFSQASIMIIFPDQKEENEDSPDKRTFADPHDQDNYHSSAITNWLSKWVAKIG